MIYFLWHVVLILELKKYSSCIVNGVRFNIVDRDKHRKTQNSGVMAQGTHNNQLIDFFWDLDRDNSVRIWL